MSADRVGVIPAGGLGCGSAVTFLGFGAGGGGAPGAAAAGSVSGSLAAGWFVAEESGEGLAASLGAGTSGFADEVSAASGVAAGLAAAGLLAGEESGAGCAAGAAGCVGVGAGGVLVPFVLPEDGTS